MYNGGFLTRTAGGFFLDIVDVSHAKLATYYVLLYFSTARAHSGDLNARNSTHARLERESENQSTAKRR